MEDARRFLEEELRGLFTPTGSLTRARYSRDLHFEDPITRLDGVDAYALMVRALKTAFNIKFTLHTINISGPDEITARWTMEVEVWALPWRPVVPFTGRSKYRVDPRSGLITSHVDTWDAVSDNSFPSAEAVALLFRQALDTTQAPQGLEQPKYEVLKAARGYEVRQYEGFLVAEAPMGSDAGPASGAGFNTLAGYIFGGNEARASMEMTTPVFSTGPSPGAGDGASTSSGGGGGAQGDGGGGRMAFVMERRFSGLADLPRPNDGRVALREVAPKYVAAARFPGYALDWDVARAERELRGALLRDGLAPAPGFRLARYNGPTDVLPWTRRNEVLIDLPEFEWP